MIREAEFRDCKRITDFLKGMHEKHGLKAKFSPDRVRQTIQVVSQNKKLHNAWVVDIDGEIEGVLVAATNRIWYSNDREAFDLAYLVSDRAKGRGAHLARRFIRWAEEAPGVKEVMMSESLGGDERLHTMMERMGLRYVGNVYRREVKT